MIGRGQKSTLKISKKRWRRWLGWDRNWEQKTDSGWGKFWILLPCWPYTQCQHLHLQIAVPWKRSTSQLDWGWYAVVWLCEMESSEQSIAHRAAPCSWWWCRGRQTSGSSPEGGRGCAVAGVDGGEQDSFRPPSRPIYDCKQIQIPRSGAAGLQNQRGCKRSEPFWQCK